MSSKKVTTVCEVKAYSDVFGTNMKETVPVIVKSNGQYFIKLTVEGNTVFIEASALIEAVNNCRG